MLKSDDKIRVGISSCLLGELVRYDGNHKRDGYITDTLGKYFEWVSICPEADGGLGVPRPSLRYERIDGEVRLMQPQTNLDVTDKVAKFSKNRIKKLAKQNIYGYILKGRSPSCGMERIKVYRGHAVRPETNGVGIYAKELMASLPNLPVEEEGRLHDPVLRENWINRVFTYYSFHRSLFPRPSVGKLVQFHTRYKFTILPHCESTYRTLGRLVADAKQRPILEVVGEYETLLMGALKKKATPARQVNVMEHLVGFFKKQLEPKVREEIRKSIADYRAEIVPMIVPITLIKHYAEILGIDYLTEQSYLNPHPKELSLRSKI